MRKSILCSVALALALAGAPARAQLALPDDSVVALNILPPGQGRYLNTPELALAQAAGIQPDSNTDQLALYESLVQGAPGLTDPAPFFKDSRFGVAPDNVARSYSPRAGVTVQRDSDYNVPHVFGRTRADATFGAGYVSAEDRMFMMDVLRHLSRGRLSELLGASDANLAADRAQRLVADYTEDELVAMGQRLLTLDPELGNLALQDLENLTAGINQYVLEMILDPLKLPAEYVALQIVPRFWKTTDSIALSTLIGGQFSVGGGGQLANDRFLDALEAGHGPGARAIFDDFRFANDPEAPTSTAEHFPFNETLPPVDPAAVARPDNTAALAAAMDAALLPPVIDGPFGEIRLAAPVGSSNALLVSKTLSATGRPLAVFGPQVGYYSPEILMEVDLHAPGFHARGAAFPGISQYALLGRGVGYAWSATTAIGDHIDIRAVELCEPAGTPTTQSLHYMHDGLCRPMYSRTDTWLAKPGAGGQPNPNPPGDEVLVSMKTERTHHGIVLARGTVGGKPAAFVRQRSSYRKEIDAALTFAEIHDPGRINSVADLQRSFDRFSFSFNWHLIDGDDIGFYTTGLYPVMAPGVDPDLPYWGDSRWDPVRYLTFAEHPQALNPPSGYIVNWNNKQAPGFRASDNWWAYGPVGRVELLDAGVRAAIAGDGKVDMAELVRAMGIAATQDLRGAEVLPQILDVIGTPSDQRLADAAARLGAWTSAGSHRRDLDGDGLYEHAPAVAIMDALWSPALEEAFKPILGESAFGAVPLGHDNGAGPGGSAYLGGWYGHLEKDLRQVLGRPVAGPFSRTYCGGGVVAACRDALLRALDRALTNLEGAEGPDPGAWGAGLKSKDSIRFSAVGVQGQRPMHWQNRPTFQQVMEFAP